MKKLICLALCLVLVLSFVACGKKDTATEGTKAPTTAPTEVPTEPATEATEKVTEDTTPAEVISSFYMDLKADETSDVYYLTASTDENGGGYLEYKTASGHKKGNVDKAAMEQIAAAFRLSNLTQLGESVYDEGGASASYSVAIGEEMFSYEYYGKFVPDEFTTAYTDMEDLFVQVMANIPEYVPAPNVGEDVDELQLDAINAILNASGYTALDSLMITNVPDDESFTYSAGLASFEGITSCTATTHMMMTVPYSLVVVTLEEGTEADTLVEAFKTNLDWTKWVCVNPSDAIIATRDNMVLCLIGLDELYTGCAAAVEAKGWTIVETLTNPNL